MLISQRERRKKRSIKKKEVDVMNLIPFETRRFWSPFRPLDTLRREIDRLFDQPILGDGDQSFFERVFAPAVDLYEDDDKVVVKADLPGVDEKGINVSIVDNVLTLKGEKKHEHEDKGQNWRRIERSYGSFVRTLALPESIDAEKVTAKYKNGVLEITAPKTEKAKTKKVAVEVK